MLKIRLQRVGKKNAPSFRVVLAEHKSPPQGRFQEILGFYNPRSKEKKFKGDRIKYWISKGAQLSPTVYNLLIDEGILSGTKIKAWRPKKSKKEAPIPEGVEKKLEEKSEEESEEELKEKEEKSKEEKKQKPEKEEKTEEKSEKKSEEGEEKKEKTPIVEEVGKKLEEKPEEESKEEKKEEEKNPEQGLENNKQKEN